MQRQRLNRDQGKGAYMEPCPDGNWVKHSDAAAQLAAKDAEIAGLTRRLALAVAEVRAWREASGTMPKQRSAADHDHDREGKWNWTGETCDECAVWIAADEARAATDADPVLAKMIEKGREG